MIVDANVLVAASLGRSLPLIEAVAATGELLIVPNAQLREAVLVSESLAARQGRASVGTTAWMQALLTPIGADRYAAHEAEARARLPAGNPQKDWPLVALAMASGEAVWSNDVDLFGTGIVVWNTHNIRRRPDLAPREDRENGHTDA